MSGLPPWPLVGFATAVVVVEMSEVVEAAPPLLPPFPGSTLWILVGLATLVVSPFPPPLLPPFPGFPPRVLVGFAGRVVFPFPPPFPFLVVAVEFENGADVAMRVDEIVLLARAVDEIVLFANEVAVAWTVEEVVLPDTVEIAPLPSSDLMPDPVVEAGGTTNPGPEATADAARA